jgi:DNA-directed RNA polymerase sigma subunit (sigma70/sigma32)
MGGGTAPIGKEPLGMETQEERVWAPLTRGRPSGFTEEEMKILVRQVRRHMADPKTVTLYGISQIYNVRREQLARIRLRSAG